MSMIQWLPNKLRGHVRRTTGIPGVFFLMFGVSLLSSSSVVLAQNKAETLVDQVVLQHEITSEFQSRPLPLRILLPQTVSDGTNSRKRLPVVYVLPVEASGEYRWGNAVQECLKHDLPNRYQMIFVFPEFSALPWFADHPSDPHLRQESYLLKSVLPLVDSHYPTDASPHGRLLTGFSKSGWGACSLLLRNPETFSAAAVFDAPLTMSEPGPYGSGPVFGDEHNFRKYQLSRLIESSAGQPAPAQRSAPIARIAMLGGGNFQREHDEFESLLKKNGVPTAIISNDRREHSWHSGWLQPAVHWLHLHHKARVHDKAGVQ